MKCLHLSSYLVLLVETHVFQRVLQVHQEYSSLLRLGEPEGGRADQHPKEIPRAVRVGRFLSGLTKT